MRCETNPKPSSVHSDVLSVAGSARLFPCWFVQQRHWVENPVHSDSAVYNLPVSLSIRGLLDYQVLEASLTEIVRRHEILRSSFTSVDGKLLQRTSDPEEMRVQVVDLTALEPTTTEAQARRLARLEALKPFELSSSPIMRGKLFRLAPEEHLLVLTTHHLVVDDWSVGILGKEFSVLYGAFSAGKTSSLPDPAFTYGDFLRWHEMFQSRVLASRLAFWRKQLEGTDGFHHLVTDRSRPGIRTNRGDCESMTLSLELSDALRTLSVREGVTLFMTFVAAFQGLLHRRSGDAAIGLGSCAANRSLVDVERTVGRFGNDFVLRTDFIGNPTFTEVLRRVRRTALEAYGHQDLPFGTVVEQLVPLRDESRNPLFQIMFILQDAPKWEFGVPGLTFNRVRIDLGTAKYDLGVWLTVNQQIEMAFEYNADLFEPQSIRRLIHQYRAVLENVTENPSLRVDRFPDPRLEADTKEVERSKTTTSYLGPRNSLEAKLVETWENTFQIRPIGIRDSFFELGGGSLLATQLCHRIERSLGRKVSITALFEASTIEELGAVLGRTSPTEKMAKIVPLQPNGSRPPFFCPCINVGAGPFFLPLARHLGDDQPFLGLALEDTHLDRLHFPYRMEEVAEHLVAAIRQQQPQGPYFLGGFCGDGVLAFETARQLNKSGETVSLLVLFEAMTPDRYNEFKGKGFQLRLILRRLAFRELKRHFVSVRQVPMRAAWGYVLDRVRDIIRDAKNLLWQASIHWTLHVRHKRLRSARKMLFVAEESYRPQSCRADIVLFRCRNRRMRRDEDEYGGWRSFVDGSLEVHTVDGDHLGILYEPNVKILATKLSACLDTAQQKNRPIAVSRVTTNSPATATLTKR
jgi:thioesterase domain-containing protein